MPILITILNVIFIEETNFCSNYFHIFAFMVEFYINESWGICKSIMLRCFFLTVIGTYVRKSKETRPTNRNPPQETHPQVYKNYTQKVKPPRKKQRQLQNNSDTVRRSPHFLLGQEIDKTIRQMPHMLKRHLYRQPKRISVGFAQQGIFG